MKYIFALLCLLLSMTAIADTLYQADVGGYSTSVGVGLGYGVSSAGVPYSFQTSTGAYSAYAGTTYTGIPYDNFNYPNSTGCCGCNQCNNCSSGYSGRCR